MHTSYYWVLDLLCVTIFKKFGVEWVLNRMLGIWASTLLFSDAWSFPRASQVLPRLQRCPRSYHGEEPLNVRRTGSWRRKRFSFAAKTSKLYSRSARTALTSSSHSSGVRKITGTFYTHALNRRFMSDVTQTLPPYPLWYRPIKGVRTYLPYLRLIYSVIPNLISLFI